LLLGGDSLENTYLVAGAAPLRHVRSRSRALVQDQQLTVRRRPRNPVRGSETAAHKKRRVLRKKQYNRSGQTITDFYLDNIYTPL